MTKRNKKVSVGNAYTSPVILTGLEFLDKQGRRKKLRIINKENNRKASKRTKNKIL